MALSTKNKRKITVGEAVFYWFFKIQYPQDILRLTVMADNKTYSRLICNFKYKDFWLSGVFENGKTYDDELLNTTSGILTPQIVRQVIDYALQRGWKPFEKGADFVIAETEAKINVDLETEAIGNRANPKSEI